MKIFAILLAAGTGKRTGFGTPKQLAKIMGKEIILRSFDIFINSAINFEKIIITTPPLNVFNFDWEKFLKEKLSPADKSIIADTGAIQKLKIITGGEQRQDSVFKALEYINKNLLSNENEKKDAIVFIHDSARPFVTDNELKSLLESAAVCGASFLYLPVTDTIKQAFDLDRSVHNLKIDKNNINNIKLIRNSDLNINSKNIEPIKSIKAANNNSRINNNEKSNKININSKDKNNAVYLQTLKKKELIAAKTPQVFKFSLIKSAMDEALKNNCNFTDDVSFIEMLGYPVKPVLSNEFNIKITSALDIELAEFLIDKFSKINK
jgi:2-C-methyl-D-erythritol 4-phosphate cytidylyltransferase